MNIIPKFIPHSEQRYASSPGYWTYDEASNTLTTFVSQMTDWRFEIAIFLHELKEATWCVAHGITQKMCDDWDDYYETLYESGAMPLTAEPGEDHNCPYHMGHMLGMSDEHITIPMLGANWQQYGKECDGLVGTE